MSQYCNQKSVTQNYIRAQYEKRYTAIVPETIKHLIFLFAQLIIPSVILSVKQDLDFFHKLSNLLQFDISQVILKYRGSEMGFSASKFHEICGNGVKSFANISIIRSNHGNVFGGFTNLAWGSHYGSMYEYRKDNEALVYIISSHDEEIERNCPIIFPIRKDAIAICCDYPNGPIYGDGHDIHISDACDKRVMFQLNGKWGYCPQWDATINFGCANWSRLRNYINDDYPNITNLCGGNETATFFNKEFNVFDVEEYEIFQLLKTQD